MWCNEVQEALPLLDPDDPDAREVLAHVEDCPACADQLGAFRADEQALAALRGSRRAAPLAGFADGVMARLGEAGPAAPLPAPAPAEEVAKPFVPERRGELLRLGSTLPALVALAAALLLAVGLLLSAPAGSLPAPSGVAVGTPGPAAPVLPQLAADPAPVAERAPAPVAPAAAGGELAAGQPLPAPVRMSDPAPMPQRRGRGMDVVPVDRGGRRGPGGLPGMPPGELPPELQLWLNRALPGLERLFAPPPPPADRPDEVRF